MRAVALIDETADRLPLARLFAFVLGLVALNLSACGGTGRVDEAETLLSPAPAAADSTTPPTFVSGDGAAPHVVCQACRGPGDCPGHELCVPSGQGDGMGLCAPG